MKRKVYEEKDAVISGRCFLAFGIILTVLAIIAIVGMHTAAHSIFPEDHSANDPIYGWFVLFALVAIVAAAAAEMMAYGILIFGCLYLAIGILVRCRKAGIVLSVFSFLLAGAYLVVWWSLVRTGAIYEWVVNPLIIAAFAVFGLFSLLLASKRLAGARWLIRRYWSVPSILLLASAFVGPVLYLWYSLTGSSLASSYKGFLFGTFKLALLFPALFFGGRWLRGRAEDTEKTDDNAPADGTGAAGSGKEPL